MCFFRLKSKRKGFTILELLIVVIIIGILSSIAIPRYRHARRTAEWTQAWAALEAIYEMARYYNDCTGNNMTFAFNNTLNAILAANYSDYHIIDIPNGAYTVGQRAVGYEIDGNWIQAGMGAGAWSVRKNILTGETETSSNALLYP